MHREREEGDVSVEIVRSEADAIAQQTQGAVICRRTVGEWEDYETADEAAQYLNEKAVARNVSRREAAAAAAVAREEAAAAARAAREEAAAAAEAAREEAAAAEAAELEEAEETPES